MDTDGWLCGVGRWVCWVCGVSVFCGVCMCCCVGPSGDSGLCVDLCVVVGLVV